MSGRRWLESGQSAVELAVVLPVFLLLLVVAADFGRVFYVSTGVNNAARAGAQYGAQTVISAADIAGMKKAAQQDGSNIPNLTATAKECTCQTSTTVTVCAASYCTNSPQATYVEVDTQASFHTIINYPAVPSAVTLSGTAVMQVQQ